MKILIKFVFVVLLFFSFDVFADVSKIPLFDLPSGAMVRVGDNDLRCYTLTEYKSILLLNIDLRDLRLKYSLLESKLSLYDEKIGYLERRSELFKQDSEIWKSEYDRLYDKWLSLQPVGTSGHSDNFWLILGGEVVIISLAITIIVVLGN